MRNFVRPVAAALSIACLAATLAIASSDSALAQGKQAPAKQAPVINDEWSKTPRNAPCPCGSGKKFKLCHGATL